MPDAPLMLSISGLRGLVGRSLTPDLTCRYASAIGSWIKTKAGDEQAVVVIGRDGRAGGQAFEQAVASGLAAVGCDVVRLGIATTPGVAIMVQHLKATGGVVITASHNPIEWNGIKAIRSDGVAPPAEEAKEIVRRFQESDFAYAEPTAIGSIAENQMTVAIHCDKVMQLVDVQAIRAAKLKAVVDSVHASGGPEAAAILDALDVERVHLYEETTGVFPHTPEPTKANLTELCSAVREHGADIGFAQDPDADRLAVVDNHGTYIGEEYTLALCAKHVLKAGDTTAANLSTSRMIDDIAEQAGATVYRSAVGEANVASMMREQASVIGGEGNGGIIDPRVSQVRDSMLGMALILDMLAKRKLALSEIVAEIPGYAIVKDKAAASEELIAAIAPKMREVFSGERLDDIDGVRVDIGTSWVHVRPSNTEPIVRLIAEAATQEQAVALIDRAKAGLGLA